MPVNNRFSWLPLGLFLLLFPLLSPAATLFGVVSERSAASLASGAELFAQQYPGHTLRLRTPEQLSALSDQQLQQLWRDADMVLLMAVFGEAVPRLERLLAEHPPRNLIAFNGDQRLTRLSRLHSQPMLEQLDDKTLKAISRNPEADADLLQHVEALKKQHPQQAAWLSARLYWQARGSDNLAALISWALAQSDARIKVPAAQPQPNIRAYWQQRFLPLSQVKLKQQPFVVLLDHDSADRAGEADLLQQMCEHLQTRKLQCVGLLARWGESTTQALADIAQLKKQAPLAAIISLQDFVIGGGEAHEQTDQLLVKLNVPVLKGIRLADRSEAQWRLSEDGLAWDTVHYRVAMPELQGISQPMVLAAMGAAQDHKLTGLRFALSQPIAAQSEQLASRVAHWSKLQTARNHDKRLAIIYYNHPPGRHNIGADNLDVPASLWQILQQLKKSGYDVGTLPKNEAELLDLIQQRGINLPQDYAAVEAMAKQVTTLPAKRYQQWFAQLPATVQAEMTSGPLGYLRSTLQQAVKNREIELGRNLLQRVHGDLRHLLEGVEHPARQRALDLLDQLRDAYAAALDGENNWSHSEQLTQALRDTGIEGFGGWGQAPGKIMVSGDKVVLPGLQFGKIFIGPQPPRGWQINEELLHANTSFPPPHQYLAFYYWLKNEFRADALIHLGRHSTYEFLPRRQVGLTADDYAAIIASDLPGIYPYIVDGVGEGIQAKRRGLAVMIDHLTPPLATTPLYEELLQLRQLIESFEAASSGDSPTKSRAVASIRQLIETLNLQAELSKIMEDELRIRGITFAQVDDEMLVHEVGHYLTKMQESFMPLGLHVFGRDWENDAINMMLTSMGDGKTPAEQHRAALSASPKAEMTALLDALDGKFVLPGKGNDPIRTPEALPTGRNFHALDASLLPTRLGHELGAQLATKARANPNTADGKEAVVLWASDAVRDEGAMVAFGMELLGVKPVWNSRGIFKGIERLPLDNGRIRRDTVFTTSGLFRDLYSQLLVWLDKSVLLALDGASDTIRQQHPALIPALEAALKPLGELATGGQESLAQNQVAAHWVEQARAQLTAGVDAKLAGRLASLRLFGDAPGAYGAGVNRLAERSGAWNERKEIAQTYLLRLGHAYGEGITGMAAQHLLRDNLSKVENTYLGRASNLYGLMDNNDAFDYLGGLSLAVETLSGKVPSNHVIHHADPKNASMQPLQTALLSELRGRFLNPAWLKPLMQHDYAGARTMGSEFMEYLWGWQVTNPDIIQSWVWDEVKSVYLEDKLKLGLDTFLEQGHNVHVKINMQAILLVAAQKGFWQADEQTLKQLAEEFAKLVVQHGLPGSGHTRPDHPMMKLVQDNIDAELAKQFAQVLQAAQHPASEANSPTPTTVAEISPQSSELAEKPAQANEIDGTQSVNWAGKILLLLVLLIMIGGIIHGRRGVK